MENTSLYLVAIELLLAFCGGILFLFSKGRLFSKADIYVTLLTIISPFWFVLTNVDGRWLGFKATLFVCCLYFSSKFPRQCMLLLAMLALIGFILDGVVSGEYLSKHVGMNANKILIMPFALIVCALFLFKHNKNNINLTILYFIVILEMFTALIIDVRASIISSLLVILLVSSVKASRVFLKYGQWIPFIYVTILSISYYFLLYESNWVSATGSNFERSAMIFSSISHFFEYPFAGPSKEFDQLAEESISVFNWTLNENSKGMDPHIFFLSFWRDEGAILTILWIFAWFYYWNKLKNLKPDLNETRMRVAIGVLAMAVVQFSLSPPGIGVRLMVALVMGSVLSFANKRSSVKINHLCKESCNSESSMV